MNISSERRSAAICVIAGCLAVAAAHAQTVIFEGARLISGDGSAAIEDGRSSFRAAISQPSASAVPFQRRRARRR